MTPKYMPKPETHAIRYLLDGTRAYWLVISPDVSLSGCARRCCNRYATFAGWQPGNNQVHGWASSPLSNVDQCGEPSADQLRRYFLAKLRAMIETDPYQPAPKFSVVRVDSIEELEEIEAVYKAEEAAIYAAHA